MSQYFTHHKWIENIYTPDYLHTMYSFVQLLYSNITKFYSLWKIKQIYVKRKK